MLEGAINLAKVLQICADIPSPCFFNYIDPCWTPLKPTKTRSYSS
jgi:hypothetical protein